MKQENIYCIYHSRDLDGWMSAAIVQKWFDETEKTGTLTMIGWDYGDPTPELMPGDRVIMVDISLSMDVMKDIAKANDLTWIDHHKSAILEYFNYEGEQQAFHVVLPEVDGGHSAEDGKFIISKLELVGACELAWKHFFPGKTMPEIVRLLGCYDSFRHKGTEESDIVFDFQYAARAYIENPQDCCNALEIGPDFTYGWIEIGRDILGYLKVEARGIYAERTEHLIQPVDAELVPLKFAAINRSRFNPSSYDIDYHKDGYHFFVCYNRRKDGRWTFSLYNADGKMDVSIIAKAQGGGGHPGAAGFVTENLNFLN